MRFMKRAVYEGRKGRATTGARTVRWEGWQGPGEKKTGMNQLIHFLRGTSAS